MYRYGKFKVILKQLRECWEKDKLTVYFSGKFDLLYNHNNLPQLDFIDEIESIDRTAYDLISKRLKGKEYDSNKPNK